MHPDRWIIWRFLMAARPRERGPRLTGKRTSELFQEVVFPYLDDALSLARWLTGNIADAEDVVQEVCVRAFAAIGAAKITNPRAWSPRSLNA